jgi:tripartite-type tricarboxylate transporter receptor subunit TctC
MTFARRVLPALATLCLLALARAQAFPSRPVRIITPFAAGVGAESTLRLFADGLSRRWGQPVPVENRPGGDGVVAAMAFLGMNDDHKVFYSFSGPFTVNPFTIPNLPYRPEQFAPISTVAIDHIAIAASPEFGASDLRDAVALARTRPGAFAWASSPGGITITFAAFAAAQRIELARAQYRAVPEMLNDLTANRIQIAAMPLATALPQARAGRIKLLAVTNAVRSPAAPDVATASEQGFPDYVFEGFVGVFADARQPAAMRAALAEATRAAVVEEAFTERVRTAGQTPFAGGEADLAARVAAQRALVEAGLRHVGSG